MSGLSHNAQLTAGAISRAFGAPQAPHVARYLARVDERLAELPNDASRRGFLGDEFAKWERRYVDFQALVRRGGEPGEATAWDFVETMGEIERRKSELVVAA